MKGATVSVALGVGEAGKFRILWELELGNTGG